MLTLFRGDDLAFAGSNREVCIKFDTELDLQGWSAKFCILDNVKETNNIASKIWTFGYTAAETEGFPLGKTFGTLVIIDAEGQVRRVAKVEVQVVNRIYDPSIKGYITVSIDNIISGDLSGLLNRITALENNVNNILKGNIPFNDVLLSCDTDPDHNYRIGIALRDDGEETGNLIPTLKIDQIPKDENESSDA